MLENFGKPTFNLRLPPGVKDFLFEEAQERRAVERCLCELLAAKSYREVITPTYEYSEVFHQASKTTKDQNGLDEKMYRFFDREGRLLALRVDFTAQIARIAASRFQNLATPIRAFYSGKVFRAEPLHAGRSHEKWQVGFEILGAGELAADAEAVFCILEGIAALGLEQARIAVGHIGYFNGIVAQAGLEGEALHELKYLMERKDVTGLKQTASALSLPELTQTTLLRLPSLHGGAEILSEARALAHNDISLQAVSQLEALMTLIQNHPHAQEVFFDLSEVEGMGYYTGIMLRAFVAGVGQEIGSGGRYDDLVARFGAHMPSVGFSFDVDLLMRALANRR